jgi:hypothetical protein
VGGIFVDYASTSNSLTAIGNAAKYNFGTSFTDFTTAPNFDLFASILNTGILTSGNFAIYDELGTDGAYTSGVDLLYLSGTLTSVSAQAGDPTLNFLFTTTGGTDQSYYGAQGGIILGDSGFLTDFSSAFGTASSTGVADVGTVSTVPEPSTVSLLLLGLGGIAFLRRRVSRA